MPLVQPAVLADFVSQIFQAAGASADVARLVAGSLVDSDLAGHESHGVVRVRQYLDSISAGEVDPAAVPVIVRELAAVTMVDACQGFGQAAARFAMESSIARARQYGVAATGIFNCAHVGRLGEWVELAAEQQMIGLAFCNGSRPGGLVAPYGSAVRMLGTNPIAAAIPVAGHPPIVIDFATGATAEGKLRVARNRGLPVPAGLILNAEGYASTDPNDFYSGGVILPAAGHKGYGLSLLVEWLGGILTGTGCPGLPGFTCLRNGVLFLVLSIEAFGPVDEVLAEGAVLYERVKSAPPAPGFAEVLLPGEPERRAAAKRRAEGIAVDEVTWRMLNEAAEALQVTAPTI